MATVRCGAKSHPNHANQPKGVVTAKNIVKRGNRAIKIKNHQP